MPDDNHIYVSWGRYDAEHQALLDRIRILENMAESQRGVDLVHRQLGDRLDDLERQVHEDEAGRKARRDRSWVVGLTVLSAVVGPVAVTVFIAWLHIHG